ncbi:F0F1 ATP synthase subunit epsilon [Clostridium tagluense]|uniref:ATP synthase epsilon chain n=1 Tax=Clostridium tagluense TaxID=360422 RepID=A0A401UGD0_9CLOT|nr:F0F1 ATP synthase subunit epsilon [Clostridium tagluense]GCD08556.1 ATP synthase epsilon chain [Clostridium tagluense]
MAKNIKLTILTPEKEFYSGEILRLNTEGEDGRFTILASHVPMVSPLKPTVTIFTDLAGKELKVFTSTGILRVYTDNVEILCSACEWPEDIDILRTKKAKERAEERLLHTDGIDLKRAENAILRSIMRMKTKE